MLKGSLGLRVLYLLYMVLSIGLLALPVVLGQSPNNPFQVPPEDLPDGPGVQGGTITIDIADEPETFNPIIPQGESTRAVTLLMHAALFEFPGRPALVEEFEISADETVYTFHLREGLQFSDGEPVSCADVEFTFNRVVFNDQVASPKRVWQISGQFPRVECLDERTVRITTPARFAGFFRLLAEQPILPKHLLAGAVEQGRFNSAWGIDVAINTPNQIAGLGPFRLKQYVRGQRVVLERNPFYWKVDLNGTQLPYLERIVLQVVRDDSVRVLRYLSSQTQLLRPRPEDVQAILDKGLWVEVQPPGVTNSNVFIFNQDAGDPALRAVFREVRFRQAISHAADRATMIARGLLEMGEERFGPGIEPGFWFGCQDQPDSPHFPFDLQQAAQVLDGLELKDTDGDGTRNITDVFLQANGISTEQLQTLPPQDERELRFEVLTVQGSKPLVSDAEIFRDALAGIGIQAEIVPVPLSSLVAALLRGDYEVARVKIFSDGDPNKISNIYHSQGQLHFWKPSDAQGEDVPEWQQRVDELLTQQKTAGEERWDLMCEFQRLVAANVPMVFLYNQSEILAWRKDLLGNFTGLIGSSGIRHSEYLFYKPSS